MSILIVSEQGFSLLSARTARPVTIQPIFLVYAGTKNIQNRENDSHFALGAGNLAIPAPDFARHISSFVLYCSAGSWFIGCFFRHIPRDFATTEGASAAKESYSRSFLPVLLILLLFTFCRYLRVRSLHLKVPSDGSRAIVY